MSEKVVKRLRRETEGTTMTASGFRALRRMYRDTPRKERRHFKVKEAVRALQAQELLHRVRAFEAIQAYKQAEPSRRRRRRRDFLMAIPMAIAAWAKGLKK